VGVVVVGAEVDSVVVDVVDDSGSSAKVVEVVLCTLVDVEGSGLDVVVASGVGTVVEAGGVVVVVVGMVKLTARRAS
jgi:hypothetical protein